MAGNSSIEWTEKTWNPVRGCTCISPGCSRCYAMRQAHRHGGIGGAFEGLTQIGAKGPVWTGEVRVVEHLVDTPRRWRKPALIFVNSMADLFHKDVPFNFVERVFKTMLETPKHTYQILTKRSERLAALAPDLPWPANVWIGVSVESDDYAGRVDDLRGVPAAVRFLSVEPLLGPVALKLDGIGWVIVGGESGPGARPMNVEWVRDVRDACVATKVPFFFKQWGGVRKRLAGRILDGRTWDELPVTMSPPTKNDHLQTAES